MREKIENVLIVVILSVFFVLLFVFSKDISFSIIFSISIWKDNLLPSLFPFFVMSDLLLAYGFVDIISFFLGAIMTKWFYLPKDAAFAFFVSLFSGFPSGSKYVNDLLNAKKISIDDANYLIMFTHFANPFFIVTTIGLFLLSNVKAGYIILISHILSNIIVAFIFRKKKVILNNDNNYKKAFYLSSPDKPFITILTNSIFKSFKTLVNMLGIIMIFLMITTIIKKIIPLTGITNGLLSGFLEMTQGVKYISSLDISLPIKASILSAIVSFSGLSVHFQVKSIIDETDIKYSNFLKARVVQSFISFFLTLAIFKIL
mgnify:FL=1